MYRYTYSRHKTYAEACAALEDYFASGEVCEGEHPEIKDMRKVFRVPLVRPFYITLGE